MNPLTKVLNRLDAVRLRLEGYRVFGKRVTVFGPFTVLNPANVSIGDNCAINHGVFIMGHHCVRIGNGVILSAGAMLLDSSIAVEGYLDNRHYEDGTIVIEDDAWIGARAVILPNVTVGRNAIVGAGSVVTKDVAPFTIVAGNPARFIKRLDTPREG